MSNSLTDKLTSLSLEKQLLGGLFQNPDVLYEIDGFFKETDLCNKTHEVLFSILKQSILSSEEINKILWGQKYKNLNISTKDEINIFEYIDAITFTQINKKGIVNSAKELVKLRIRRDIFKDAQEVQSFVVGAKCADKTVTEMVAEVDSIYNKRINVISTDDEPQDLFDGITNYINKNAEKPVEEAGLITPFKQYNKWFSGLKIGDGSYLFSARLSEGKSVWMFNLAKGVAILNNCKVLYLDTEMSLDLNRDRAAAAEIGINPYYLQTGKWTKNRELADKVNNSFNKFDKYRGLFFHKYVGNKNIKEIMSIARKWKLKNVGRDEKALVILDYLKITENATSEGRSEWQTFGDWVSYLNEFGASYNAAISIAAQQNRQANQNGVRLDDDTTIGGSDRIGQFARFAAIIRRKTLDEVAEHGPKYGSHILKPIKFSRDQGEQDYINNRLVKVPNPQGKPKYIEDFINLKIDNYAISECGTFRDVVKDKNYGKPLEQNGEKQDNVDI